MGVRRWVAAGVLLGAACLTGSCQLVSGLNEYEVVATAWQRSWGGEGTELVTAVAIDAQDNVLIAGVFNSPVSFGGATLLPSGGLEPFFAKLDVSGNHLWSQSFVSSAVALPVSLVVTPAGDIAVVGLFSGTMDLGGQVLDAGGTAAVFVAQLSADGSPQWGRAFPGYTLSTLLELDNAPSLEAGNNGDLVVRLQLSEPLMVFDEQLTPSGADDFALVRVSPQGDKRWVRHISSGQGQFNSFVPTLRPPLAIDAQGRTVVAGQFRGNFSVQGTELVAQSLLDAFVARFADDGTLLDARRFGGSSGQFITAVAVDGPGNVVVTGAYFGELEIDGAVFPTLGGDDGADVFLSTFNEADLSHQRSFTFAAVATQDNELSAYVVSLDVNDQQEVLMSGAVGGSVTFGQEQLIALGGSDLFFAKLDAAGVPIVATRYGGVNEDIAYDGVLDGRGHVVVGGGFSGQIKVGTETLISQGDSDAFVIKWVP